MRQRDKAEIREHVFKGREFLAVLWHLRQGAVHGTQELTACPLGARRD
jgi:hypothetical protein